MRKLIVGNSIIPVTLLGAVSALTVDAHATAYTWQPVTGTSLAWNSAANWSPNTGFPNNSGAPADVANLNNNITGNQTISLNTNVVIGTLNYGDSNGSNTFGINSGNTLTFQGATAGSATALNLGATGSAANTISAPVKLGGTSSLTVNVGGTQSLTFFGGVDLNDNAMTITGPASTLTAINVLFNSAATNSGSGANGRLITNQKISFAGPTANLSGVKTLTINGAFTYSGSTLLQNGGSVNVGDSQQPASNPGQRLPTDTIMLNGGTLSDSGQASNGVAWTSVVQDTVAKVRLNSGYSNITLQAQSGSGGTTLSVTTLERGNGGTAYVRSTTLGGTAKVLLGNYASLVGAGTVTPATTNMPIIPWIVANNTNSATSTPVGFATYINGGAGLRSLVSGEYATSIVAGQNVNLGNFSALSTNTSINSLVLGFNTSTIGTGKVLTIASGGVYFGQFNSGLGTAGSATAGTVNFDGAEGVLWTTGTNSNTLGSIITGSGGITKAGVGTLTLAGNNNYTGLTIVSSGTLRVGDGTNASNIRGGNVQVASGAILQLSSVNDILDTATVTLDQIGIFNGKMVLDTGINEQVAGLYLGTVLQPAGTYGSTTSAATFKDDTYFSGTGILNVVLVPEPTVGSLLGSVGMMLLARRRRAS